MACAMCRGPVSLPTNSWQWAKEPHQLPYRAGLNMVKHAGLQRCWQQRLQPRLYSSSPVRKPDQDLGIVLLDEPLGDLGEAVDGPALVMTGELTPMAMSGRVGSTPAASGVSRPVVSPSPGQGGGCVLPGEARGLEQ